MSNMNRTMQEALRLMQTGDLHAATQAIQRGLRGGAEPAYAAAEFGVESASARCIEGQYRIITDSPSEAVRTPRTTERTDNLRSKTRDDEFRFVPGSTPVTGVGRSVSLRRTFLAHEIHETTRNRSSGKKRDNPANNYFVTISATDKLWPTTPVRDAFRNQKN